MPAVGDRLIPLPGFEALVEEVAFGHHFEVVLPVELVYNQKWFAGSGHRLTGNVRLLVRFFKVSGSAQSSLALIFERAAV
jgi:hypothetical protein